MLKRLAAIMLLLVPSAASAVTYTVTTNAQMTTANASVAPGDVVRIMGGTYTTLPLPAAVGTAENPITYLGAISDPDSVKLSGNLAAKVNYVRYHYMRVTGNVTVAPDGTSGNHTLNGSIGGVRGIKLLRINGYNGDLTIENAQDCRVDSSWFGYLPTTTKSFSLRTQWSLANAYKRLKATRDSLTNNTIYRANVDVESNAPIINWAKFENDDDIVCGLGDSYSCQSAESLFVDNNKFTAVNRLGATYDGPNSSGSMVWFWGIRNSRFEDNRYDLVDSSGHDLSALRRHAYRIRGITQNNRFVRDSVIASGTKATFLLSTYSDPWIRQTQGRNRWDYCYFKSGVTTAEYGPFLFQWGLNGDTLTNSVFLANFAKDGSGCMNLGFVDSLGGYVRHNTFFAAQAPSAMLMSPTSQYDKWGNALVLMDNIFYAPVNTGGTKAAMFIVTWAGKRLVCDYNLFYAPPDSTRALRFRNPECPADMPYPDTGNLCNESSMEFTQIDRPNNWHEFRKSDHNSRYGDPLFANSTFASFDPTPGAASVARGRGSLGSDIGAIQPTADAIRPDEITDLSVADKSSQSVELQWTAVGDDSLTGTAKSYDVRYATVLADIDTDAEFFNNPQASGISSVIPYPAGYGESWSITGLTSGTVYYIAIKARDEKGNYSGVSNILTVRTEYEFDATEWE